MRNIVLGAALLISGLMGASANAMPMTQPLARDKPDIQTVDYACGRGYHLSPGASAGRTARHATNASGGVAAIGKLGASGGNARQGGSGKSVERGNANVSGDEDMTTVIAGNMSGR